MSKLAMLSASALFLCACPSSSPSSSTDNHTPSATLGDPVARLSSPAADAAALAARVIAVVRKQFSKQARAISRATRIREDLGGDSLDLVELILSFEETFQLEIPDQDTGVFCKVGDAIDYLARRGAQPR